jgi:hypothetical protein
MTVTQEQQGDSERRTIYIVAAAVVVVLIVVGLIAHHSAKETTSAQMKANQLIAALAATGAHTPTRDMVVRVLGDDGGALCNDPASGLRKGILFDQITNGAGGPGMRPVIGDSRIVKGQLLVLKIYCPDQLPDFQKLADQLKFDNVVKG